MAIELKSAVPGRLVGGRFYPNPKGSGSEDALYRVFRKRGYSRREARRLAKLNAPYFVSNPADRWVEAKGSPIKKIRFRSDGDVDVIVEGAENPTTRRGNESYRKVKKQVRKLQRSGALEPGPMFQKFRKAAGISKTGRKRNYTFRYTAHQLRSKQWEIKDNLTGRVVQTVKTKPAALQAVTKWNAREGLSGAWQMRGNPSSYIVYPGTGSPKSFGFLKSAKKWAKEQANASGISSVVYPQGKGKTHHVYPDRKAKNPAVFYDVVDQTGYPLSRSHRVMLDAVRRMKQIRSEDKRSKVPEYRNRKLKVVRRIA